MWGDPNCAPSPYHEGMKGKWALVSVAAVAAGAGVGALSLRQRKIAPPPVRAAAAAVVAAPEITLPGEIRPQHMAKVLAPASGVVDEFQADVGQDVFQGQSLARIGGSALQSAHESAAAAVEHAQSEVAKAEGGVTAARMEASRADADMQRSRMALERLQQAWTRQQTLFAAGATPRLTYEKTQREFEAAQQEFAAIDKEAHLAGEQVQMALNQVSSAKKLLADRSAELDDAQIDLEAAEVRSPTDGLVIARHGEAGKPVDEGASLFEIASDLYSLEVVVEPGSSVLPKIRAGQPALVLVLDLQSAGMPGSVKRIDGTQVVVEFNSTLPAIKPGMRADVRLKLD
jgi:HlyD family secretion protein